ncbi:MAG: TonB-dependent receptor, partial [Candidatus Helarchaeota archaeon]|nr:TonB-dependent receptor [Candidatus Helarchaeota archaeon]
KIIKNYKLKRKVKNIKNKVIFKNFKIKIYFLLLILFFDYSLSFSQKLDTLKVYYLGEIEVTAKRERTRVFTTRNDVLTERIESTNSLNISDALKFLPGTRVACNSRNEMTVDIRGYTQRQVTILLDGVPVYVPYDGMIDLSQIPVENVDMIAVVKGVSSILYGPNSMGGVINIITGESTRGGGSYYKFASSTNISRIFNFRQYGKKGILSYFFSGGYVKSDGFKLSKKIKGDIENNIRNNSDFIKRSLFSKIILNPSAGNKLGFSFNYIDNKKGLPSSISAARPRYWRFTNWKKWVLNSTWEFIINPNLMVKSILFYDKYYNVLDSYDDENYNSQTKKYSFHSTYDDHSVGGMIYSLYNLKETNFLKFSASLKRDIHNQQSNRNESFKRYEADTYSFGIEDEIKMSEEFSMIFGAGLDIINPVFADNNPVFKKFDAFKPEFGLNYIINEKSSFHFSVGKKSRFPTLKELYSGYIGKSISNPDLRGEGSISAESGFRFNFGGKSSGMFTIFYDNIKDLIVNVPMGEGIGQLNNIGKVISGGIETLYRMSFSNLSYEVNYTLLKMKNVSPGRTSDYVEYHPEHRLNMLFSYRLKYGFVYYGELFYIGKQRYINFDTGNWGRLKDYALASMKISKSFLKNSVYFRIDN